MIILAVLSATGKTEAQSYPFREYTAIDGLPDNLTNYIMQDSRGFIWIMTTNRLARFDGTEFVIYSRTDSVFNQSLADVFEDSEKNIWMYGLYGLSKYTGNGFNHFFPSGDLEIKLFTGHPVSFDGNNNMYLVCMKKERTNGSIVVFNDSIYSDYSVNYRALDTLDISAVAYDGTTRALVILTSDSRLWLWKNGNLLFLHDEVLGVGRSTVGVEVNIGKKGYYHYSNGRLIPQDPVNSSGKPGLQMNPFQYEGYVRYYDGISILPLKIPYTSYNYSFDTEGCLWLGSDNSLRRLLSIAFSSIAEKETGLETVWTIIADKNDHIWLGSLRKGDLVEYDGHNFKTRNEFKKVMPEYSVFYKGSRLMENGNIWFSMKRGVLVWDGKSFSKLKDISADAQVCYIYEDPDNGTKIIGTSLGIYLIRNGLTELDTRFVDDKLGVIEGVTKDDDGIYWLSGHKGIFRFDGTNATRIKQGILPDISTFTIVKDYRGGIWVTSNSGLLFKGKQTEKFISGLPEVVNAPAKSIIIMDSTHVLLGRVADICIIDLERFYNNEKTYYRIYDKSDGFDGIECLDNGIVKDNSGNFWILTSDRLVRFNPSRLKKNINPPKLNITGLYFKNDSLEWITAEKGGFFYNIPENIVLKKFQNTIRVTYTGISTTNPTKVKYRHMLEGYDRKWSLPASLGSKDYEKLPPGKYAFMLKASNADGVETPQPLVFRFTILPAFWQTKLFILTILILTVALIVTITWLILKREQQRKEQKSQLINELSQLQMKLVIRQFDPHFTFNVISSIGTLILKEQRETAYEYIIKLASLLRTVLSDGAPMIKPLSEELDFVQRYCELTKLRFKERFSFSIILGKDVNLGRLIPKMLIQTFVENSIKHGFENLEQGGQVDISLSTAENSLLIVIRDNGIGRNDTEIKKSYGTGHGFRIINAIFEEMNTGNDSPARFEIIDLAKTGESSGTEIRIIIPDDYKFVIHEKRYEKKYTLI